MWVVGCVRGFVFHLKSILVVVVRCGWLTVDARDIWNWTVKMKLGLSFYLGVLSTNLFLRCYWRGRNIVGSMCATFEDFIKAIRWLKYPPVLDL